MSTIRSLAFFAGCALALGLGGTAALAADLPTKAPPMTPPAAPPPSLWSGFIEVGYEWGQVNPQGQAVYKEGDYNIVAGANLNLYKSKDGFINSVTIGGLGIVDFAGSSTLGPNDSFWANNNPTEGGAGLYYILSANMTIAFAQYWTLKEEFFHLSGINANGSNFNNFNAATGNTTGQCSWSHFAPGATLGCLDLPAWYWNNLTLQFSDGAITNWPISFNPYITWWYNIYGSGSAGSFAGTTSAACFSCNSETSDFLLGIVPKINMQQYWGVPLTFTAPTYFTVGPKSFWEGNNTAGPGSGCVLNAPNCSSSNFGVFSTGLTASYALSSIPAQWGHWSVKAGFSYFDIINKALQADNQVTYGPGSSCPTVTVGNVSTHTPCAAGNQQNIFVAFVGLGVGF
jgi:hypothetical protein